MNLYEEKDGIFQVDAGANITDVIRDGLRLSANLSRPIAFEFNGVIVTVAHDSDPALIHREWTRALNQHIDNRIGPYPSPTLTLDEQANDARIEAEAEQRRAIAQAKYDADDNAKADRVNAALRDAPAMVLADAAAWQASKDANPDGYGGAVLAFAERWARLMQVKIDAGQRLEDVADALVGDADLEGITGFMCGCAVSILSQAWVNGDTLRRWHNLKTQIGTEGERANERGGVLNPALLSLGDES